MASNPPLSRTVRPVMMTQGRYASQGMIAPTGFVDAEGNLNDTSFRFLHSLFMSISQLQQDVATLQQRLANAGIP